MLEVIFIILHTDSSGRFTMMPHNPSRIMKHLFTKTILTLLLLLPMNGAYSQGTWQKMKQKAKSAWNSDTRKQLWEKTKEKASAVTESDMLKQFEYTVPITNRSFYNLVPDKYLLPYSKAVCGIHSQ